MPLPEPPKVAAVEVIAAQPTETDRAAVAHMGAAEPKAVYVVKVKLKAKPPVTSMAWALYVNDELVSKYWEYADGIYFTVSDPQFFTRHRGKQLRFSQNGTASNVPSCFRWTPTVSSIRTIRRASRIPKRWIPPMPLSCCCVFAVGTSRR